MNLEEKILAAILDLPKRIAKALGQSDGSPHILLILERLSQLEHRVMTKLDDLGAAIADLGTTQQAIVDGLGNLTTVIQTEDAAIQAAITALGNNTDPQVQALIDAVTQQKQNISTAAQSVADLATDAQTQATNLTAALPPAP